MSAIEVGLKVILMFFILVSIHEWGHFYFAKRAGILVREFAIGFGPKIFSYKKGETRYTLRLLPIGGFVRMAGEDPEIVQVNPGQTIAIKLNKQNEVSSLFLDQLDRRSNVILGIVEHIDLERTLQVSLDVDGERVTYPVDREAMMVTKGVETQIAPYDRQFGSKTVGKRAIAIVMGPVMNFLLAIVLFLIVVIMSGVFTNVKLDSVLAGKAGEKAGLQKGDIIISIDNQPIGSDREKLVTTIQSSAGKPMTWVIDRAGNPLTLQVTPETEAGSGKLGVVISGDRRSASFGEVISGTYEQVVGTTIGIVTGLQKLVMLQFKLDDLGGPVRTAQVSAQFAQMGITVFLSWMATLSLYLGIFNLLPIPALDGSRLLFMGLEALRGKPIDPNRESMVHFVGFALLMLLMVAVTYNDILRLIKG
ncbi:MULTISPECIES: RIP metalloprotease RseP [Paenibacillus]|uniref:Zinc metalloprotease n=1 Tax=Paenibacillus violae TaxID=3077234 RepID=A0ABU3RAM2_9BACL|nr:MULTISPECIES: RIP metalloprotease RseP [Paenibacillus]MDU0201320.1 RIP metalloprotease RseP [Paenibacillus sp. PFR10]MEC0265232.1 RIP metalloprotease RseP [Paenibacillus anseongense]